MSCSTSRTNRRGTTATTRSSAGSARHPRYAALETLTSDQRAVVLLRDVADLSVADTAAVLGKKPGAIKTTHRRALAALANRVSGESVR